MLHYSKFVNTKAQQKAAIQKQRRVELPDLSRPDLVSAERRRELLSKAAEIAAEEKQKLEKENERKVDGPKVHGSVNLEEMQRIEELRRQDEDWLSFFMGKPAAYEEPLEAASEAPAEPSMDPLFQSSELLQSAIMTPAPITEASLAFSDSEKLNPCFFFEESVPPLISIGTLELADSFLPEQESGPTCLNQIFDELIQDDRIFSRSSD